MFDVRLALLVAVWASGGAGCGLVGFEPSPARQLDGRPGDPADAAAAVVDASRPDAPGAGVCAAMPCAGPTVAVACGTRCVASCEELMPVAAAKTRCAAWGGRLLSIADTAEETCAESVLTPGQLGYWLALEQNAAAVAPAEGWTWIDGVPFLYTDWALSEPNDVDDVESGQEQCGIIYDTGTWNDVDCGEGYALLCGR